MSFWNNFNLLYFTRHAEDRFLESVICVVLVEQICLGSGFVKAIAQTQVTLPYRIRHYRTWKYL